MDVDDVSSVGRRGSSRKGNAWMEGKLLGGEMKRMLPSVTREDWIPAGFKERQNILNSVYYFKKTVSILE